MKVAVNKYSGIVKNTTEMEKQPGGADGFSGDQKVAELAAISDNGTAEVDLFYEKLAKLNHSSGLTSVFNFRDAMLDLHGFYKEVIKQGGFYQVTKMGKWDDVASVSNSKSCVSITAVQLQNVYKMLILQYELMYFRKMPDEANTWPAKDSLGYFGPWPSPSCSKGKRNDCDSSYPFSKVHLSNLDGRTDKKNDCNVTWKEAKGPETVNKNSNMIMSPKSEVKEFAEDKPEAPRKPSSGYNIFLRLESSRLKIVLGESSSGQTIRKMAVAAWKSLSKKDKLPFIEASKLDKERYRKEMAAYKQLQENQNGKSQTLSTTETPCMLNFSASTVPDDVYHVSLQDDSENLQLPDESMIELAIEVMNNAESHESIFQID